MSDLISREKVVDILSKMKFFQGTRAGRELWNDKPIEIQEQDLESFNKGIETIRKYILQLEEQPKVGEWIPVEERLPDETDNDYYPAMNVTTRGSTVQWGFYRCDDGYWYLYNEEMQEWEIAEKGQVLAWMPLPEPFDMRKKVEELLWPKKKWTSNLN